MNPPFYLVKIRPINVFNLPMALLLQSAGMLTEQPCIFTVDDFGFINIAVGDYVKSQCDDPVRDFRSLDWSQKLDSLDHSLNQSILKNQIFVSSTYRSDQMDLLKNHYRDRILTIGIDHTESTYNLLLHIFAKQHIHSLKTGVLTITDVDNEVLNNPDIDTVKYYVDAFDRQQILPRSDSNKYDYSIPIIDFYSQQSMEKHLNHLDLPFTAESLAFYTRWLELNSQ